MLEYEGQGVGWWSESLTSKELSSEKVGGLATGAACSWRHAPFLVFVSVSFLKSCTPACLTWLSSLVPVGHQSSLQLVPPGNQRMPLSPTIDTSFKTSKAFLAMKLQLLSSEVVNCQDFYSQPAGSLVSSRSTGRLTTYPASIEQPKLASGCQLQTLQQDNLTVQIYLPKSFLFHYYIHARYKITKVFFIDICK